MSGPCGRRAPPLFATDFKFFFCRASDPPTVKKLKIEMLTAVADSGRAVTSDQPKPSCVHSCHHSSPLPSEVLKSLKSSN